MLPNEDHSTPRTADGDGPLSAEELKQLRAALPSAAFQTKPTKLITLAIHGSTVATAFFFASHTPGWWSLPLAGLVAGHSVACIGFLAHELSHATIIRHKHARLCCERIFWGMALVSVTMWRRTHNNTHHAFLNTHLDSDRRFLTTEETPFRKWYVRLTYPSAESFPWNPLVWLYMNIYFLRNVICAFLPQGKGLPVVPSSPAYRDGDATRVVTDLLAIIAIQAGLFALTGWSPRAFLLLLAISQLSASVVSMSYIFTNHFLNPVALKPDAIRATTSVIVPRWIDRLHSHYSYHTEHHIFPTLNSAFYPDLSALLQQRYPERYQRIPISEAWARLWRQRAFASDPRQISDAP